jgi:hypothetical protein
LPWIRWWRCGPSEPVGLNRFTFVAKRQQRDAKNACETGEIVLWCEPACQPPSPPSNRGATARYTHVVGDWAMRGIGALLIAVLAGSPAVDAVCGALCSGAPRATTPGHTGDASHHPDTAERAASDADGAPGSHDHRAAATIAESSSESQAQIADASVRDCCSSPGQPRASRRAVRADASLLAPPQLAILPTATAFCHAESVPIERHSVRPPGPLSPSPTLLSLRI